MGGQINSLAANSGVLLWGIWNHCFELNGGLIEFVLVTLLWRMFCSRDRNVSVKNEIITSGDYLLVGQREMVSIIIF